MGHALKFRNQNKQNKDVVVDSSYSDGGQHSVASNINQYKQNKDIKKRRYYLRETNMSLTEEESNFFRFYFLNLKIASKAVRVYFDYVHPPAGLARELANNSVTLKGLRFMTKLQLNILYPSPGQTVTSAEFDSTLIVCLLRNLPPRESAPVTGWDNLPLPGDTSKGADLARIKWYRNKLVHTNDGNIVVNRFQSVLGRFRRYMLNIQRDCNIHNLQITQEEHTSMINDLQKAIDNQKIVKEHHENKIHQLYDSLPKGEGGSKQKRLEEDTRALIEEDVREGTFVITKAVTDGLLLLKQNGVLLITGHAGTGKTRIGRHVLQMFCTDDTSYKCIKLNTLAEWEDMVNREDHVAVLIDDIFGETNCIYNREKDTPILEKVHAYVCRGNIKVIMTIRDTVKRQCQELFDSNNLFQFEFINLSAGRYVLRRKEKENMLTNYMKTVRRSDYTDNKGFLDNNGDTILGENGVQEIINENPVKGFPLVVYQFVHNNKYFKLGSKFFDRPTEAILEQMNAIRRKGKDQRKFMIQYAVMVYTAINENCINPEDKTCVQEVINIIDAIYGEKIEMKKCHILDAVKDLKGSYLVNIPNQRPYKLHHPTLQESVILSFAQIDEENINKIIPLISWSFFLKMVKPELYKEKEGEVVLRVPSNSYKVLAKRLVDFYIEKSGTSQLPRFIINLCNTEIFQHEYSILLPFLLDALEMEDDRDKHTENMIKSVEIGNFVLQIKNKDTFFAFLLNTLAELESQFDIYNFVLKTFETTIKTSSNHLTIGFMKSALISSLYVISSTKDVRSVKATLDIIEENKIPVLLDQGIITTNICDIPNISDLFTKFDTECYYEPCVFLTLCIWKAYEVLNIPVLEFLLSKYNQSPFDINLFFKMIYKDIWIKQMLISFRKSILDWPSLSFEPLKWMIETFKDQELYDPNFILRTGCKYQMYVTVKYVASVCKTFDEISCLQAFVDKPENLRIGVPFNKKIFDFIIKRIDTTSTDLTPVVKSVIKKQNVPDYICDAFLPVCINNANLLTLACENGQFYLVNLIIESSHIEQLDIQSALIAAFRECERNFFFYHKKADEKLKIVKYMVEKVGFEQIDLKAVCQQECSKRIEILEWFVQNIDIPRLDVYTIINSTLVNKRSDILIHIMNKVEIESLDKWKVLKSVSEQYTAECSTTILEIVRTIWDSTHDKEVLHMEEMVNKAYERKCFELLMWIHENCHPHISIDSKKVLMLACEDNRLDVAKWVLQTFEQTSLDIDGGNLFMIACSKTCEILQEQFIEMVKWILASFQIKGSDFKSGVLKVISVTMRISNESLNSVIYLLEKYFSLLNTDDIKEILNKSLEQKNYFLLNWFLKERSYCSFDKQMVLNKACSDHEIETIKILSKYFYALDMTQAMINVCTSPSRFRSGRLNEKYYNADQSVGCLSLLWNEVNKTGHDSIDIRTIVSTVCKEKKVRNNIMTWILLNLPLDQIQINEVLITCCQQSKIHHVKYILHKVAIDQLDIRKAFVKACQACPGDFQFLLQNCKPQCRDEMWQKEENKPKYLMIVDSLFQMQSEKDSYLSLVKNEIIENKKFDLMLYFLQTGYCRNINMTDRLKEACRYGKCKLVQWIVVNVELKELDIKSAFHEACDGVNYRVIPFGEKQLENIKCLALMWHYIHDINMFEIDTVLNKMTETSDSNSDNDMKTWLLYIKNINKRIYQSDNALLNTEEYTNKPSQQVNDGQCCLEDLQDNYDLNSKDEQDDYSTPKKRLRLEREMQK
ncbi:Hypothetical predicted protein [Mytilus galloprovincialis]|uniref:DZIP3-like HEPN domain-containing protein n=1 Tax=Mytilus galloprovincialis TaxID=29158 RepID=A0A8B6H5M9_MYTGA|nr:Hypothetical predicted protein [Mytilus galloprovincialis]